MPTFMIIFSYSFITLTPKLEKSDLEGRVDKMNESKNTNNNLKKKKIQKLMKKSL